MHVSARIRAEIERVPAIDVRSPGGAKLFQSGEKANVEIEVQNLTFSYPSRPDHNTLDDISFVLEAGKVTALVGAKHGYKLAVFAIIYYLFSIWFGKGRAQMIALRGIYSHTTVYDRVPPASLLRPVTPQQRNPEFSACTQILTDHIPSSRSRILGFRTSARAAAIRCLWPPDNTPVRPLLIRVSIPAGNLHTKSHA